MLFKYVNVRLTQNDDYNGQTHDLAHTDVHNENKLLVWH